MPDRNGEILATQMPAILEYIDRVPSVHDLFSTLESSDEGTPVLYTDMGVALNGKRAFVFCPENQEKAVSL